MKNALRRKMFAQQVAVFFVSGLFVLGGILSNASNAIASIFDATFADMTTPQCRALANNADCIATDACDSSYTNLAPGKSCDAPGSYAGSCCVKAASFTCPGTCKSSINTSSGEWNDQGGSKACAIKSPNTPLCARVSATPAPKTDSPTTKPINPDSPTTKPINPDSPTTKPTNPDSPTTKPTTGGDTTTGGVTPISFTNPLKFNTVQDVLGSLLSALQGIIVILSIIFIVIGAVLYVTSAGNSKQTELAKSAITASMIGLALGIAAPSFLKEISTILGWDAAPVEVSGALSLSAILTNVLTFLTGIVGILAIIMLVIGALMYLSAAGDEDRIDDGKKIVRFSIIGIIIAFAALIIVKQIAGFFL